MKKPQELERLIEKTIEMYKLHKKKRKQRKKQRK